MAAKRAGVNGLPAKHAPNGKSAPRKSKPAKDSTFDLPESDDEAPAARSAKPAPRSGRNRVTAKTQKRAALSDDEPQASAARVSKPQPTIDSDVFDFPISDGDTPRPKASAKRTQKATAGSAPPPKAKKRDTPAIEEGDASRKRKRPEQLPAKRPEQLPAKKPATKQSSIPLRPGAQIDSSTSGPAKNRAKRTSPSHVPSSESPPRTAITKSHDKTTPVRRGPVKQPSTQSLASIDLEELPSNELTLALSSQLESAIPLELEPFRTPSPTRSQSPEAFAKHGSVTPRQAVLWSKLLGRSNKALVPADTLKAGRDRAGPQRLSAIPRSSPDVAEERKAKRVRLVDTLKKTTKKAGVESDSSSGEESSSGDEAENGHDGAMNSQSSALPHSQTLVKVTYGQERTYMEESNEDEMFETLMDDLDETPKPAGSQRAVDLDPVSEEEDESGQPKSIHDLRAAGTKKRLLHELESLISGIKGEGFNSASSKRIDLLELTKKLLNPATSQFFLDHGLESGLVACLAQSKDAIFDFIGALALNCLLKTTTNLSAVRHVWSSGFLARLLKLLDMNLDIATTVRERRFNLSKVSQSAITEMKPAVMEAEIWPDPVPSCLSPRIVALIAIERLIRKTRELGNSDALVDESIITQLIETQKWDASSPDYALEAELTISALESSSVGISLKEQNPWSTTSLQGLAAHLPKILLSKESGLSRARNLALRLSLNITNNNKGACDEFAIQEFIAALMTLIIRDFSGISSVDEGSVVFDELILSLGAMINMAELSDTARTRMLNDDSKILGRTVELFQMGLDKTKQAESVEASKTNVPYGYLALLLVNLCQNDKVRKHILGLLRDAQLDALIAAAEEFIRINQQTDRELFSGAEGAEVHETYTKRLLGMVDRLKVLASHG